MQRVNLSFYQRQNKSVKDVTIYCRITINGKRLDISTGVKINPYIFDTSKNHAKGRSFQAVQVNTRLDQLRSEINGIIIKYDQKGKKLTIDLLKSDLTGKNEKTKSLQYVYRMHNKDISLRIGNGYSDATLEKYNLTKYHLEQYLLKNYNSSDQQLSELNYGFISGFEGFILNDKKNSISSTNKHTQRLKKVINFAILNEWMDRDPFIRHRPIKEESKEIIYLDDEELKAIEDKEFEIDRLAKVRDFFVFCCYTGLAFKDVLTLTKKDITKDIDGELQLVYKRQKTGKIIFIPLLPKALEIIEKYKDDQMTTMSCKLLPIPSNVKFNAYLKEIADVCGINKNLTVHTARKTFATTVLLLNDVPMETASELLGHYSVKMTQQLYGKIVNKKIKRDINKLKEKLAGS
ncbi:MAG: site-specific integrase [Cyclobacteriaceae bacterium]|nr:site-specific integrase [Cyclobacteriaceae bacterium]